MNKIKYIVAVLLTLSLAISIFCLSKTNFHTTSASYVKNKNKLDNNPFNVDLMIHAPLLKKKQYYSATVVNDKLQTIKFDNCAIIKGTKNIKCFMKDNSYIFTVNSYINHKKTYFSGASLTINGERPKMIFYGPNHYHNINHYIFMTHDYTKPANNINAS